MTLVEKIIEAIDQAYECRECGTLVAIGGRHITDCDCARPSWDAASTKNKAIAALRAMREPTEGMLDAAIYEESNLTALGHTQVWQAMIDQAIKEGE